MTEPGRILGVDYGSVHLGLAMSDPGGAIAFRHGEIRAAGADADAKALREIVVRENVSEVVIGLPLHLDGSSSASSRGVEEFAEILRGRVAVPVTLWDERLTSAEAGGLLRFGGASRATRKKNVHILSAQILLQSCLDARRRT
ncbi:MAG: Holliday junction resolvase RuvX [Planctomycetota bacterium]